MDPPVAGRLVGQSPGPSLPVHPHVCRPCDGRLANDRYLRCENSEIRRGIPSDSGAHDQTPDSENRIGTTSMEAGAIRKLRTEEAIPNPAFDLSATSFQRASWWTSQPVGRGVSRLDGPVLRLD